jgi:hypothetical protein
MVDLGGIAVPPVIWRAFFFVGTKASDNKSLTAFATQNDSERRWDAFEQGKFQS